MARKGKSKGREEEGERENITAYQISNPSQSTHIKCID